ncbi:MAG: DUF6166 domain-containing protein [Rhodovibrionaceae bacterium]|nr:DUF6166 domain-containing protein [Rhodovibrionaceae bacterium]
MKVYRGDRTIDGVYVTVDDRPLDQRLDLKEISKNGFEWSYEGPEPEQLALAILADCVGDDVAMQNYRTFMKEIVANFQNDWEMTEADVKAALETA